MSVTIDDLLKSAKELQANLLDESERVLLTNEAVIIRLQTAQIESGKGSDGKALRNRNSLFSGRYTLSTELISKSDPLIPDKIAGDLYHFLNTGVFLSSFDIELSADKTKLFINNTGTGSGEKKSFFDGYGDTLTGLDEENSDVLNYDILLPKLQEFASRYL